MVDGCQLTSRPTRTISRMLGGALCYSLTPLPPTQLAPGLAGYMGLGRSLASGSSCFLFNWNAGFSDSEFSFWGVQWEATFLHHITDRNGECS